jgi:hypothetical protein
MVAIHYQETTGEDIGVFIYGAVLYFVECIDL